MYKYKAVHLSFTETGNMVVVFDVTKSKRPVEHFLQGAETCHNSTTATCLKVAFYIILFSYKLLNISVIHKLFLQIHRSIILYVHLQI